MRLTLLRRAPRKQNAPRCCPTHRRHIRDARPSVVAHFNYTKLIRRPSPTTPTSNFATRLFHQKLTLTAGAMIYEESHIQIAVRNPAGILGVFRPTLTEWTGRWTPEEELAHQRLIQRLRQMSAEEVFQVAVSAGIYTPEGELTPRYRSDELPAGSMQR